MNRKIRTIGVALIGGALLSSTLGAASTTTDKTTKGGPSTASYLSCLDKNQVCLYEDAGWNGDEYGRVSTRGFRELGGWNGDNEISSVLNDTPYCLWLYAGDEMGGRWLKVGPKQGVGTLKDKNFNDDVESYMVDRCSSGP